MMAFWISLFELLAIFCSSAVATVNSELFPKNTALENLFEASTLLSYFSILWRRATSNLAF